MKYLATALVVASSLMSACGSGGAGTAPTATPSYPTVAGAWNGRLIGATPESSADVRLTIEQSSDRVLGSLQRIHGLWTATIVTRQIGGNFNGGVATDGRMQFTLNAGSADCNFSMDVRVTGNRIDGSFSTVGPTGCTPTSVSPSGRVELLRE